MPDLVKTHRPRARKAQWCNACQARIIQSGDVYQRNTYAYDGCVYDWLLCLPCEAITQRVFSWWHRPEEGIGPDEYQDWATDHHNDPEVGEAAMAYLERANPEVARQLKEEK